MTKSKSKSAAAAAAQADINDMLADAAREDKRSNARFPSLDELSALAAQREPEVPRWKQLRIEFCKHYNIDVSRISVKQNGDLVGQFKAWCAEQDRLDAAAMS